MNRPLGRFQELAATITSLFVVAAAILLHAYLIVFEAGAPDHPDLALIDGAFWLAIGLLLGQTQVINGAGRIANAAHLRLDAVGAPSAAAVTEVPTAAAARRPVAAVPDAEQGRE